MARKAKKSVSLLNIYTADREWLLKICATSQFAKIKSRLSIVVGIKYL